MDWARNERIGGNIFERIITLNTGFAIFLGFTQLSEKNFLLVYFNEADATIIASPYVYNEEIFKERGFKFSAQQKTETDWTELHKIVSFGDLEELKETLNKVTSPDALTTTTKQGSTPLHMAIWRGFPDRVECLLEKGAGANDDQSLVLAFRKYAELKQEPRLQICVALIKDILVNKRTAILNNLRNNRSNFSFDFISTVTLNNFKIDIEIVVVLFQLEKLGYVRNIQLWLRQLVFSLIIKPLQLKKQIDVNQSLPLSEEEQMIFLAKELATCSIEIPSMEFRSLFGGLWHQFSTKPDLIRANQEFTCASKLYSEAYLFLGYQLATGKGQPRNYNSAGECYFRAFIEISKEFSNLTKTQETVSLQSLLLNLEEAAIAFLQNLYQQDPPSRNAKAHISFLLVKCYCEQNNYQNAREQIEKTEIDFLTPQERTELNEFAALAYYHLSKKTQDNQEKITLLNKASNTGHGAAALELAKIAINKQPQSDFFEAASHCIDALTATCYTMTLEASSQLFANMDKLLGDGAANEEKICEIVFKAAVTILKKIPSTENRWPTYKSFLQNLAKSPKLPKKAKSDIEYALFSCFKDGREVSREELGISYTKTMGMGMFGALKKSKEEIDAEKQQKIVDKIAALEKQDTSIAQRFSDALASESKESDSDVDMPLYLPVEAVVSQNPNLTLPTAQVISTETSEEPSLSEQKNNQLEIELEKLKSELEQLRSENSALKNASQKSNDSDLAKENVELKNKLAKSQKEIAELKSKFTKTEATVARLSKSNSTWNRPKIEVLKEEKTDQQSRSPLHDSESLNF